MALLLQCLRDVRTKAGDPDLIPPMNEYGLRGDHHRDGDEARVDASAPAANASTFATHSEREPDEARH